jgi:LPXTG-motif cell wall-anchored protein
MSKEKKNVFWLGVTSFFTDISSEMIFAILPIFLKVVLGAPFLAIGLIEGLAEGVSSFLKYFSGWFSDFLKKRKSLAFAGYLFSTVSKMFLILANSWLFVLLLRILDRVGKGIRTSPRDALIAESVEAKERGKYFGLHRAMDTAGAFLGVGLVILIFYLTFRQISPSEEQIAPIIRNIFLIAFIPALFALLPFLFIRDVISQNQNQKPARLFNLKGFPLAFYKGVFILTLLAFANISYAFLLLKSKSLGVALFLLPVLYLIYNFFYAIFSYPAGKLSDKLGRVNFLAFGFFVLGLVFFSFAFIKDSLLVWLLFAFYGLSLAITDSVSKAFVADISQEDRKGEAFGFYYLLIGLATIVGNFLFGFLMDKINENLPFLLAGILLLGGAFLLFIFFRKHTFLPQEQDIRSFKGYRS